MGGLVCYHSQVNGLTAFSVREAELRRLPRRVRRRRHCVGFPGASASVAIVLASIGCGVVVALQRGR